MVAASAGAPPAAPGRGVPPPAREARGPAPPGLVAVGALGQRDPPAGQEVADAVLAGLAVDVLVVVVLAELGRRRVPTPQELVEGALPGGLVHLRGLGEDTVEVEEAGSDVVGESQHARHVTAISRVSPVETCSVCAGPGVGVVAPPGGRWLCWVCAAIALGDGGFGIR